VALGRAISGEVRQPVWVGHSCPTLLTLVLSLGLTSLSVEVSINTNIDGDVNGVGQECPTHTRIQMANRTLDRKYDYRRMLPHYQKAGRALFVTFCKGGRTAFSPEARDAVLRHCLHHRGRRYELHAAVVMPDHVQLLLTPLRDEKGWPYSLPTILKLLKGTSARSVNKLSGSRGPVWQEESFDHVLRSQESFEAKLEYLRQNPVRRGLVKKPKDYQWLWVEQAAEK
jgi:putative transposase